MQAVLCDICASPIHGRALELQSVWGEAVQTEEGRPRIVARSTSSMHFLCARCGDWTQAAMNHLRANVTAATVRTAM